MSEIDPEIIKYWRMTCDGLKKSQWPHMARILENQKIFNRNEGLHPQFRRISFSMLKRIYSGLHAHNWVNVESLYGADATTKLCGIREKNSEENEIEEFTFVINEFALEVTDRQSKVSFGSLDAMQDLGSVNGIDGQAELVSINAIESTLEIDRMILQDIIEVAPRMTITKNVWVNDPGRTFMQMASSVFKNSYRSPANWAVASPQNLSMLNLEDQSGLGIRKRQLQNPPATGVMKGMSLYEDSSFSNNIIVAGYKNENITTNAGYTYALGYIDQNENEPDPNAFFALPKSNLIFTESKIMSDPNYFIVVEIIG